MGIFLRIDCSVVEEGLRTTHCSQCALDALAIDEPLEYARLALTVTCKCGLMQKIVWNYGELMYIFAHAE